MENKFLAALLKKIAARLENASRNFSANQEDDLDDFGDENDLNFGDSGFLSFSIANPGTYETRNSLYVLKQHGQNTRSRQSQWQLKQPQKFILQSIRKNNY